MDATQPLQNVNVRSFTPLLAPLQLLAELPASPAATQTVRQAREDIKRILAGEDRRILLIVGPCSIHDEKAACEYAGRLRALAERVRATIHIIMRVYFEKPRTIAGWKGLINDPRLNETFDVTEGLRAARRILRAVSDMGLPAATEFLDPIVPQYIADLVSEAAIGARTTESPTHRQMASGLSMPVAFKNGTDGSLSSAINAILAAREAHSFLGIDEVGRTAIVNTGGNPWGHLILRGGRSGPNYSPKALAQTADALTTAGLAARFMVDCSHDNSGKDHRKQAEVWRAMLAQRAAGGTSVIGLMLESNLRPGKQQLGGGLLEYGVSITDACIGWEETESLILSAHETLASVKPRP